MSFLSYLQRNTGQQGSDYVKNEVNAERVWIQGVTGCNVTIAVVDGGNGLHIATAMT